MYKSKHFRHAMEPDNNINPRFADAKKLLDTAKQAFKEAAGIDMKLTEAVQPGKNQPDAVLQFHTPEAKTKKYYPEIKKEITKAALLSYLAERTGRFDKPGILVAWYVNPQMAEHLKEKNIAFIDAAGNAYINDPPIYIFITGRRKRHIPEKTTVGRAFKPAGLKVVFALLCQPELAKAPYRDIVKAANVAQGTVGWVMHDLKQQNFLAVRGRLGRKLINAARLFDLWVETYARELRPRLYIGKYKTRKNDWWKNFNHQNTGALLGGEPAAAFLTDYLKPGAITVYVPEEINQFLLANHLRKARDGDVELFQKFWGFQYQWNDKNIVPPVLVYADLVAMGNDRNLEVAKMIYDKFIYRSIEQV